MLSTSPDRSTAASPPGPLSSQSSSVGSCYTSESSRASFQARPTLSDPSSSSTSPASAYERASEQPYASALFKRPAQSTANATSPSFEGRPNDHSLASRASPHLERHRAMQPPVSGASGIRDAGHPSAFQRAGPSSSSATDASPHATRDMQPFSSPDNHRGPLAKARRTSPGGSRASGLDASHDFAHYSQANSPASLSRSPDTSSSAAALATHTSPATHANGFASTKASSSSTADRSMAGVRPKPPSLPKMDLATFAPQELLKILATLLHEIATANDEFQPEGSKGESSRRKGAKSRDRSAPATPADPDISRDYTAPPGSHLSFNDSRRPSVTTAALGALATPSSTLCFHARNVPSISIESYLLRILKYCPTTNEVFLSLLVYFDRMSRMGTGAKPGANGDGQVAGEAAGLPRANERATGQPSFETTARPSDGAESYTHPGIRGFAIDSYNVHRLVIAGVTVASKFFSDVFYTNSRYAKVGGLPPHELNQLELQFLLLNDFRLTIPLEEMQRYADQLLMYASGCPEMAKLTKPVVLDAAPDADGNGNGSSASFVGERATPTATMGSTRVFDGGASGADAQGDVQMSER